MLLVNSEVDLIRCFHSWCLNKGPVGCQDTNEVIPMPYMGMGQNFVLTHEHQNSWWNGCSFRIWFAGQVLPNPHVQPGWYPQFLPGRHHEVCPQHLDHQQTLPEPHLDRLGPLKKKIRRRGRFLDALVFHLSKTKRFHTMLPGSRWLFWLWFFCQTSTAFHGCCSRGLAKMGWHAPFTTLCFPFQPPDCHNRKWSCQNGRPKKKADPTLQYIGI